MATGLSFFPVDRIAMLAANDFLTNPTLMICTYLEWAAAMKALARSGQLSLSASTILEEVSVVTCMGTAPVAEARRRSVHGARAPSCPQVAETVSQTPAACLDYFDAEYAKVDADGEYAGYSISGHILYNVAVLDQSDPEHQQLPLMMTKPLAIIQLALKVRPPSWVTVFV